MSKLQWKEGGRYFETAIGHLYVFIEKIDAYKEPGHPDHEPEHFEWFIAPDDEDKCYRRAIAGSDRSRIATFQEAKTAAIAAIRRLGQALLDGVGDDKP